MNPAINPVTSSSSPTRTVPDSFGEGTPQRPRVSGDASLNELRQNKDANRDRLRGDLESLYNEFETASHDKLPELRTRLRAALDQAKESSHDVYGELRGVVRELGNYARQNAVMAKGQAEQMIGANPWRSVAAAAVIGLLAGALISRRS